LTIQYLLGAGPALPRSLQLSMYQPCMKVPDSVKDKKPLAHTDPVDLSGGPNIAEITQTVACPQTECPPAPVQYHLGHVHIRISLLSGPCLFCCM